MVTAVRKKVSEMTQEEVLAWRQKNDLETERIADAIDLGITKRERIYGEALSARKRKKIAGLVETALDALPYASGCQPLTDADVEFAQHFASGLAGNMMGKKQLTTGTFR